MTATDRGDPGSAGTGRVRRAGSGLPAERIIADLGRALGRGLGIGDYGRLERLWARLRNRHFRSGPGSGQDCLVSPPHQDPTEPRFELRYPPLPTMWKVFIVGWFAFTVLFVVGGIAGGIPIAAILIGIVLIGGLAWLLKRRPHLGVLVYDDELVICNFFRVLTVPRADIAGFRIVTPSLSESLRTNSGRRPLVQLVRRDDSVVGLNVTATTPMNIASAPTDDALRLLSAWLANNGER